MNFREVDDGKDFEMFQMNDENSKGNTLTKKKRFKS